ncbi:MAG: amidohydrolase [Lachnospiraceae bacterium]|nr:amidohydrolase [Lachnospiraceae bacterium]
MRIRFYNCRILSMKDSMEVGQGEVWVDGRHISYVGEKRPSDQTFDREVDVQGNLIMPGFKNAHTHSSMTFLRSYADDLPLQEWLNDKVFPLEAKLSGEDMRQLAKVAILEYLTSGITCNFDMYLNPCAVAQASVDCGFRTVLVGAMNDFSQSPQELDEWYQKLNAYDPLIRFCLGFHAEYTTSLWRLEKVAELAEKYKAPVYCHNSETKTEVRQCIDRYGKTPTAFLDGLGMFRYGGGGYHCVHFSRQDMEIFRERGLYVVTNPGSNSKLASGIAPIAQMLEMGIPIALGTDGPASNNCLDMFREMFLTTALAKLREEDASAVDAQEVLRMAVCQGARAMELPECDCLDVGKLADLIIIDLHQPNMQPLNHIPKNLVYSGSKQNVKMTMVDGNILYEDGKFYVGEDPEAIYAHANEIARRIQA